jgi:hypothetical protein
MPFIPGVARKGKLMFMTLTAIAVLTVLYALAWHDQPAREPVQQPPNNQKPSSPTVTPNL